MRRTAGTLVAAVSLGWGVVPTAVADHLNHSVVIYGYPPAPRCPLAGVAKKVDRWKMFTCNCTSYVAWALQVNGQRTDWFVPGAMDARNWPNVAWRAGIPSGGTPRIGAVAVWPRYSPPFGHVAYVTDVHSDGTFDVAEYNLGPRFGVPKFTFDRRYGLTPHGVVFVYVPVSDGEEGFR